MFLTDGWIVPTKFILFCKFYKVDIVKKKSSVLVTGEPKGGILSCDHLLELQHCV